eukprot:Tbor_TRINITY_DN6191_c0_g2::TRINITY_DN6191_c0_g2_i2::g.22336::m.22336
MEQYDRLGMEAQVLQYIETPLFPKGHNDLNTLMIDITHTRQTKGGEAYTSQKRTYREIFASPKEKEVKGGELLLHQREDGLVDGTCIETEVLRQKELIEQVVKHLQQASTQPPPTHYPQQGNNHFYTQEGPRGRSYNYRGTVRGY